MHETMGNQLETNTFHFGWLAGIIDGEGCFTCLTNQYKSTIHYQPSMQIANTDLGLIIRVKDILNSIGVSCHIHTRQYKPNHKPIHLLKVTGFKRVKKLLDEFYPYVVCKQNRAKTLYDFVTSRLSKPRLSPVSDEERKLYENLRLLNQRGIEGASETTRQAG